MLCNTLEFGFPVMSYGLEIMIMLFFNQTSMQDSEGAHGETKDILQDDNKENIPVFIAEDIVNENTTTIALSQVC